MNNSQKKEEAKKLLDTLGVIINLAQFIPGQKARLLPLVISYNAARRLIEKTGSEEYVVKAISILTAALGKAVKILPKDLNNVPPVTDFEKKPFTQTTNPSIVAGEPNVTESAVLLGRSLARKASTLASRVKNAVKEKQPVEPEPRTEIIVSEVQVMNDYLDVDLGTLRKVVQKFEGKPDSARVRVFDPNRS